MGFFLRIAPNRFICYIPRMTASAQLVLEEAIRLPSVDRASIIEKLIASFDVSGRKTIDDAWADESESRLDAFQAGKLTARPFGDVMKEMNA